MILEPAVLMTLYVHSYINNDSMYSTLSLLIFMIKKSTVTYYCGIKLILLSLYVYTSVVTTYTIVHTSPRGSSVTINMNYLTVNNTLKVTADVL